MFTNFRFTSTITAEFNGHTHSDELKLFYNSEGNPINVAWGGGSATTYSNYNLNYKIATFDSGTFVSIIKMFDILRYEFRRPKVSGLLVGMLENKL